MSQDCPRNGHYLPGSVKLVVTPPPPTPGGSAIDVYTLTPPKPTDTGTAMGHANVLCGNAVAGWAGGWESHEVGQKVRTRNRQVAVLPLTRSHYFQYLVRLIKCAVWAAACAACFVSVSVRFRFRFRLVGGGHW